MISCTFLNTNKIGMRCKITYKNKKDFPNNYNSNNDTSKDLIQVPGKFVQKM